MSGGEFSLRRVAGASIVAGLSTACAAADPGDFYLRAGIGLDRPTETVFSDRDCSSGGALWWPCPREPRRTG